MDSPKTQSGLLVLIHLKSLLKTWVVGLHPQEALVSWIWESISDIFSGSRQVQDTIRTHAPKFWNSLLHVKATAFSFKLALILEFAFIC